MHGHFTLWVQEHMPERWRNLITRDMEGNPNPAGQVWGVPYRWGCTLIAYRKDPLLRCQALHVYSIKTLSDK